MHVIVIHLLFIYIAQHIPAGSNSYLEFSLNRFLKQLLFYKMYHKEPINHLSLSLFYPYNPLTYRSVTDSFYQV